MSRWDERTKGKQRAALMSARRRLAKEHRILLAEAPQGTLWGAIRRDHDKTAVAVGRRLARVEEALDRLMISDAPRDAAQHEWITRPRFVRHDGSPLPFCRLCGNVKHGDGRPEKPCRGIARLALRDGSS